MQREARVTAGKTGPIGERGLKGYMGRTGEKGNMGPKRFTRCGGGTQGVQGIW